MPSKIVVPMVKPTNNAVRVLGAFVSEKDKTFTIMELSKKLNIKYATLRLTIHWLAARGYVENVGMRGNAAIFATTVEDMQQYEYIVAKGFDGIATISPEILESTKHVIDGQPLESWLRGYASKAGRNNNAKKQTDMIPFIIAELFNIAIKARDEKPWVIQARLEDLKEKADLIITTFERLLSIVKQIKGNSILWDSRYTRFLLAREGNLLDLEELQTCIDAVRKNYGVPDASYE